VAAQQSGDLVMYELRAREAWSQREYRAARLLAATAVELAARTEDHHAWWNMTFLQAECLREEGSLDESLQSAEALSINSLTLQSEALKARVHTLAAVCQQGLGHLDQAVDSATIAVKSAAAVPDAPELQIEAHHALIAALAESDRLDEAWSACLELSTHITPDIHTQTAGKAYWAIGNVAFMRHQVDDGTRFHRLAAEHLTPNNDLELWARFNRASASRRLAAAVVDAETLECIERAEVASSVVGGTERDKLQLSLTRAHWLFLTGQVNAAVERLRPICAEGSALSRQTEGEANLLLAQALSARGEALEALAHFETSEQCFDDAGAPDRAAHVRAIVTGLRS
jgi:tetratricopeptide (TPR) repeat protein